MSKILDFAKELIANGFRVWYCPSNPTFIHAAIDGQLGYVGEAIGVGYRYGTIHEPNLSTGTGFEFSEGALDVEEMRRCCEAMAPGWWRGSLDSVKKWKTIDEWLKKNSYMVEIKGEENAS